MTSVSLVARLDGIFAQLQSLKPDSPLLDFEKAASFFAPDCTAYLRSMRERSTPAIGREAVIKHLQEIVKEYQLQKHHVISQAVDEKASRIFSEMENQYLIHGYTVDPFPETVIAVFNTDGLISSFKLYCCQSHLVHFMQVATGRGPYSAAYMKYAYTSLPYSKYVFNQLGNMKMIIAVAKFRISEAGLYKINSYTL